MMLVVHRATDRSHGGGVLDRPPSNGAGGLQDASAEPGAPRGEVGTASFTRQTLPSCCRDTRRVKARSWSLLSTCFT